MYCLNALSFEPPETPSKSTTSITQVSVGNLEQYFPKILQK